MNLRFKVEDDSPGIVATGEVCMIMKQIGQDSSSRLCKNSTFASVCAYVITQCILEIE
jgi:hypothetical protein